MAAGISSPKTANCTLDDPQVREAVIKALTYPTTAYKEGFVPPSAINWNDADDNNAFHSKLTVMDLDGSLSTEVAIIKNKEDYDDIVTMGLALSNDGKPVPSMAGSFSGLIPKGAKNVAVAKDFLKYLIQPEVLNEYLKTGLGRREPPMPSIVKKDPWWLDPTTRTGWPTPLRSCCARPCRLLGLQPGLGEVESEHVWQQGLGRRSCRTGRRRMARRKRRSSGPRRSLPNTRSRRRECRIARQLAAIQCWSDLIRVRQLGEMTRMTLSQRCVSLL